MSLDVSWEFFFCLFFPVLWIPRCAPQPFQFFPFIAAFADEKISPKTEELVTNIPLPVKPGPGLYRALSVQKHDFASPLWLLLRVPHPVLSGHP